MTTILTLSPGSLDVRYLADAEKFKTMNRMVQISLPLDLNTATVASTVKNILGMMKAQGLTGKYVEQISHFDANVQTQLWLLRNVLFYQIMTVVALCMSHPETYVQFFSDGAFLSEFSKELGQFSVGIFGSMSPTSDIDVGITYNGACNTPCLAYVVKLFESLFLILTGGLSSLAFDIEMYADMITLPNRNEATRNQYPYFFYLDTSSLSDQHFMQMKPIALLSVARNAVLAYKECNEFLDPTKLLLETIENEMMNKTSVQDFRKDPSITALVRTSDKTFTECLVEMQEFLSLSYDSQRMKYYSSVEQAETLVRALYPGNTMTTVTVDQTCALCVLIGRALAYRMESYLCPPTVVHVVRILQAAPQLVQKYKTSNPFVYCNNSFHSLDAFCSLGQHGYILSMLEQIGYMYRFYRTYCRYNCHFDQTKCDKKIKKYEERFINGMDFLKQFRLPMPAATMSAGRKRTRRQNRKQGRSRRRLSQQRRQQRRR